MSSSILSLTLSSAPLPEFLQPPLPSVFTLEVTERCQHRCAGCGNVFAHSPYEMDLAEWAVILERLQPYAQALRITGGEPTMHRQFRLLLAAIDDVGVPFVLFTNGNWRKPDEVLDVLLACRHLRGLLISLHGAEAHSYQRFVGVDVFEAVVANIQRAARAGLPVATNTLLLTTTYEHITAVVDLSLSLGANTVCFGRYYGTPQAGLSLSDEQLRDTLRKIAALRKHDRRITLSNCVPTCFLPNVDFGERGCTSGFTHCTIGPRGEIRPCTHASVALGHMQYDDLAQVWQSTRLNDWRQRVPITCRRCAAFSRCRGGCRATAQECRLPHDPLMISPLSQLDMMPPIELAWDDRPRLIGNLHEIKSGYALSGPGKYVTLSASGRNIVQALDRQMTIAELYDRYGPAALQLIGSLTYLRLVALS